MSVLGSIQFSYGSGAEGVLKSVCDIIDLKRQLDDVQGRKRISVLAF